MRFPLFVYLHDEVLALLEFHASIDDASQDTPSIVQIQINLQAERLK